MFKKFAMALVATTAAAAPAHAEAGDFLVRFRGILVAPNEDTGGVVPTFPAEDASVSNSFMPEVDFTYMLARNVGAELILATTKHHADGKTGTTGSIGRLASTWVLPPTLTLQYHFAPDAAIRPYVGAGVNYTIFYSEKASHGIEAAVGDTDVRMKDSFGYALQAGVDIPISDRAFINFDVKYIDIDTTARLDTTAIGTQRLKMHLDPFVFGVGIGLKL